MSDLLLDTHDLAEAVRALLDTEIGAFAAHASPLPAEAVAPYNLVSVRGPHPDGPMMAGDQTLDATVSVTTVGSNAEHTERGAAAVRELLVGRDGRGAFSTAITVAGRAVIGRECNYDGAPDIVQGVPQWTETYQLIVGRA